MKDGYYWIALQRDPGRPAEWMVALAVDGDGWQLPGELNSLPFGDRRILSVGEEVVR